MAKQSEQDSIIARVAAEHLAPLGCKRVGRSRRWISDQRAWVIVVEFQPSSYSRGSYLNVAPAWLWYPKDYLTFDFGPVRFNGFISFEETEQFQLEAETMAKLAAQAVMKFRDELESPATMVERLVNDISERASWRTYHAAVATGLIGDVGSSSRLFAQVLTAESDIDWFIRLQRHCSELVAKLYDRPSFRQAIFADISYTRALNKLKSDPNCLDDWFANGD